MRTLWWLIAVLLFLGAVGEIRFWKDPGPPFPAFRPPVFPLLAKDGSIIHQIGLTVTPPRLAIAIVDLNGMPWETVERNHNNVKIDVPPAGWTRLTFVLRNTGDASLVHPRYHFVASPESVFVDAADFRAGRKNHNLYELRGGNYVLPSSVPGTPDTQVSVDVTIPAAVANFILVFNADALNSDALETTLHFAATHQQ